MIYNRYRAEEIYYKFLAVYTSLKKIDFKYRKVNKSSINFDDTMYIIYMEPEVVEVLTS